MLPAFYALDRRKTPMIVSFVAVGLNLPLSWIFTFHLGWGHRGLAFSTACIATINFLILHWLMRKRLRRFEGRAMLTLLAKVSAASAALAVVCWASTHWLLAD